MFKVTSEPQFTHAVKVQEPVDGGFKESTFKVRFRVIPMDQLKAEDGEEGEAAQKVSLRKVIVSMSDLIGEDDQPLPYSDDLRDQLLDMAYVRLALLQTYTKALTKVKTGN